MSVVHALVLTPEAQDALVTLLAPVDHTRLMRGRLTVPAPCGRQVVLATVNADTLDLVANAVVNAARTLANAEMDDAAPEDGRFARRFASDVARGVAERVGVAVERARKTVLARGGSPASSTNIAFEGAPQPSLLYEYEDWEGESTIYVSHVRPRAKDNDYRGGVEGWLEDGAYWSGTFDDWSEVGGDRLVGGAAPEYDERIPVVCRRRAGEATRAVVGEVTHEVGELLESRKGRVYRLSRVAFGRGTTLHLVDPDSPAEHVELAGTKAALRGWRRVSSASATAPAEAPTAL